MAIDLALRTGVVFAVIMATRHYNIWDSSDEAQEVFNTATKRAGPYAKYLNINIPQLPPNRKTSFLGIYYYNQTVMTLGDLLNMIPTYIHAVLEQVPGVVSEFGRRAREQYDKYQKQRAQKNETKERKTCIDEKALVQPVKPYRDSNCTCQQKCPTEPMPPLLAKDPKKECPCRNSSEIPPCKRLEPQYLPDKKCECPKCDIREADGWSDNKPKCRKRDASDSKSAAQLKDTQRK